MEAGDNMGLGSSLRQSLLSGNRVPPIATHHESNQSGLTTPRGHSARVLVPGPIARGEGSLADALLLRGARVSPALNG